MPVSIQTYEKNIWNLNNQIVLIRFSFRHLSRTPDVRAKFIKERTDQILAGWSHFARTEPEQFCGWEHFLVPTFAKKESEWLSKNLHAVIEFSEHRLNQMELVMRYALFEAVLTGVVGNILWEYPNLIENAVHNCLDAPKSKNKRSDEDDDDFRARRTEKLVRSVDYLTYKPTSKSSASQEKNPNQPTCLFENLKKGLDLEVEQQKHADILEKVREVRNKIAHRSDVSPRTLTDDFMKEVRSALSEFPRRLIRVAADEYPDACTTESLDGDSERPGYLIRNLLKDI